MSGERKHRVDPEWECVHCGTLISADSRFELMQEYTNHVVREHNKPAISPRDDTDPSMINHTK